MIATEWAHLPNAVHIDRVIASALANPGHWKETRGETCDTTWSATWDILQEQGRAMVRVAGAATYDPILALCAYDDCAYMIDSDPGELAILAKFGDPRAILLLSACKVFHLLKTNA